MKTFYQEITEWLLPLGYIECFRQTTQAGQEYHFIKDRVRVVCFKEYCYLSIDLLHKPVPVTVKSGRYNLGTARLDFVHEQIKCFDA